MAHGHLHLGGGPGHGGPGHGYGNTPPAVRRGLILAVALCALATVVGLMALWPSGRDTSAIASFGFTDLVDATVTSVEIGPCEGSPPDSVDCDRILARITEGPTRGDLAELTLVVGPASPVLEPRDGIVLSYAPEQPERFRYAFAEYQRETPMLVLGVIFVTAVLLLGRWRGVGALAGLAASLGVLTVFVLPALLDGRSAVPVALTGAAVIAFVALYLAHGVNLQTTVALLATMAALALTGLLATVFVGASRFTGLGSEESFFLQIATEQVDLRGILLAGIVIGALGVLDDVTVTQVSAVWELHRVRPDAGRAELYASALRIGRDHISSTVNTLVLAYAGASLPLLLLFTQAGQPLSAIATGEVVAVEVVRALVGSVALVASVPISTGLAALVVGRRSPDGDQGPQAGAGGAQAVPE